MDTLTLVWINTLVLACLAFPTLWCALVVFRDVRGLGRNDRRQTELMREHNEIMRGILAEQNALARVMRELNESLKR